MSVGPLFVDAAGRWRDRAGRYVSEARVVRWLDREYARGRAPEREIPPPGGMTLRRYAFPPPLVTRQDDRVPDGGVLDEGEGAAVEWEFGAEYEGQGGGGRGSPVDINLRVWRTDRAPMRESEARGVLAALMDRLNQTGGRVSWSHPVPGYAMSAINWRAPRGGWRPSHGTGGPSDLQAFDNVLYMLADVALWRVGAVDDDEPGW